MLDGIANGTVTIKNGNFYTTDQNILDNKDIFGQVTYYLKSQLGKSENIFLLKKKEKLIFQTMHLERILIIMYLIAMILI